MAIGASGKQSRRRGAAASQPDFRHLLDSFADAVVAADAAGRIVYANRSVAGLLGWDPQDLLDRDLVTIIPERLRPVHQRSFDRFTTTGAGTLLGIPIRLPALHRLGHEVEVELTLGHLADGGPAVVVGVLRDLAERVELERQVSVARALRATTDLASQLSTRRTVDGIAESVVATLTGEFGAALAEVWEREGGALQCLATSAAGGPVAATPDDLLLEAAEQGQAAIVNRDVAGTVVAGRAVFPILFGQDVRGVVVFGSSAPITAEVAEVLPTLVAVVTAWWKGAEVLAWEQQARTEAENRQRQLGFLAEATQLLSSSLDYERTLRNLVELVVPRMADWCTLDMVAADGSIERLAVTHTDADKVPLAIEVQTRWPDPPDAPYGLPAVLRTGRSAYYPVISDESFELAAQDPDHLALLRRLGTRSTMIVPLVVRGRPVGGITLATAESGRRYTEEDLTLAEELARRAAVAVDNARLHHQVQEAGARFQTLVETIDAIVFEINVQEPAFTFVSPRALDLLGHPPETWMADARAFLEAVHPEDRDAAAEFFRHTVESRGVGDHDLRIHAADGTLKWFRAIVRAVTQEGEVTAVAGLLVDISERMRIQRLEDAQHAVTRVLADATSLTDAGFRLLQAVCEGLDWQIGALWTVDPATDDMRCVTLWGQPDTQAPRFVEVTRRLRVVKGQGLPGTVWEQGDAMWVPDVTRIPTFPRAEVAAAEGLHSAFAFPIRWGGEVRGVLEFFSPVVREPDPEVLRLVRAAGTQISQFIQRTAAEEELRFQKTLLESQSEATIDGILVTDAEGCLLFANRRFREIFGLGPDDVINSREERMEVIRRSVGDGSSPRHLAIAGDTDGAYQDVIRLADGRVLDRYSAPVVSGDGVSYGRAWYYRDVTDQKRVEAELREGRERVEALAGTLQQSLLPPLLPDVPGVEVASRYHFAGGGSDVGGDFYDLFYTGGDAWAMVIGDVCGKGPQAAAITGLARYTVRAAAMRNRRPSRILATLNEAMLRNEADTRFATVAFTRVEPQGDGVTVTIASGGHPLPLLLRPDGSVTPVGTTGTLLGIFPDPELVDDSVDLGPGDALLLYTDGATEARAEDRVFGEDRLHALLSSCAGLDAEGIVSRIEEAILAFQEGVPRDDVALLVMRVSTEPRIQSDPAVDSREW